MAEPTQRAPVYEDIKVFIRRRIENGELPSGARVPSEYQLARELGVSRNRTRLALRELEVEGYVIRRRGSGTYVAPLPNHIPVADLGSNRPVVISFPKFESRYSRRVVEGFMAYMGHHKVPAIAYHLHSDHQSEVQALRSIVDSGVSGLVAWLEHDTPTLRAFLDSLRRRRFPIVLVDRYVDYPGVDCVTSANEEMGYTLTKALIANGHRRIAFAGYRPGVSSALDRYRGYRRAMEETQAKPRIGGGPVEPFEPIAIDFADLTDNCRNAIRDVMAMRDKPTAFVCMHDKVMFRVHRETAALGFSTPDDIAFAAIDDMHPCAEFPPVPLATTVAQRAITLGTESAKVLRARMASPEAQAQRIAIPSGPLVEEPKGIVAVEAESA